MTDIRTDPNRTPTIGSEPDSNGRTDERTYVEGGYGRRSGSFAERAREASKDSVGFVSIGDVIAAGALWATGQRHEVTRIGERAEIPRHVRAAVWYRDYDPAPVVAELKGHIHHDRTPDTENAHPIPHTTTTPEGEDA